MSAVLPASSLVGRLLLRPGRMGDMRSSQAGWWTLFKHQASLGQLNGNFDAGYPMKYRATKIFSIVGTNAHRKGISQELEFLQKISGTTILTSYLCFSTILRRKGLEARTFVSFCSSSAPTSPVSVAGHQRRHSPGPVYTVTAALQDVWAVGCITFELLVGRTLFEAEEGETWTREDDDLAKMIELTGETSTESSLARANRRTEFFDEKGNLRRVDIIPGKCIENFLRTFNTIPEDEVADAASLIRCCPRLDPNDRPSALNEVETQCAATGQYRSFTFEGFVA
ncbi:hypothetical protein K474DRAFT_1709722 [Panus rudis PR-1116 ss-1]|nr:hypothetical protein K474DRAFT_1709722 [Panus rudis PR-1116 ss-1]